MAEKFSTQETPLSAEDFGLVLVGEGDEQTALVMLTTGNGLYKGSYDQVMDKKSNKDFTVEVDGQKIDTRQAMTWKAYQAIIEQAKASGTDPLPDSNSLSAQNDQPWTATWLTGELASWFGADYGYVDDMGPYRRWSDRDRDWFNLRVRPAAVV